MTAERVSYRDVLVIAAIYTFSLLYLAGFPHVRLAYPLDDSWIHQVVARNLASDGTLGFMPGARSSGSSSLLWSFLLAAKWKFAPTLNPVVYTYFLNWLALIATGTGLLAIARRDGLPETSCWIWALTPSLNGNFVWLGIVGMEHVLFVALSVLGIYFWFEESRFSVILTALFLGALSVTRPEGAALTALVLLATRWARRSRRDVLILILIVLVFFVAGLAANRVTSNSWLPLTYVGRKWLYFGSDAIPLKTRLMFARVVLGFGVHAWVFQPMHLLSVTMHMLFALAIWRLWQLRGARCGLLCMWGGALIAIYAAMLPALGHAGRYQPMFLMLSFPMMFLGVEVIVRGVLGFFKISSARAPIPQIALLAVCLLCGVLSLRVWRRATQDGMTVIESTHAIMGQLLINTFHQQTRVAAFDIGRMGYAYGGHLSDLGGLTDSSFLPYLRQDRVLDYMEDRSIQYFVWPSMTDGSGAMDNFMKFTPEVKRRLVPMAMICAPAEAVRVSFEASWAAAPCQKLYRLKETGAAADGPVGNAAAALRQQGARSTVMPE